MMLWRRRRSTSAALIGLIVSSYLLALKFVKDLTVSSYTTGTLQILHKSNNNHNSNDNNDDGTAISLRDLSPSISSYAKQKKCGAEAPFKPLNLQIFTILPANFTDRHQQAIESWRSAVPEENIFILADETQDCPRLIALGFPRIHCESHRCMHPDLNLPLAQCIFQQGKRLLNGIGRLGIFINSDVYTSPSFFASLACVDSMLDQFVAIGQRYDIIRMRDDASDRNILDRDSGTDNRDTSSTIEGPGKLLHGAYGLDYFAFTHPFLDEVDLKEFVLGAWRWDNYLLSETIKQGRFITVDMTKTARVYHEQQKRNFQHHSIRHGATHNDRIVQQFSNKDYKFGSTEHAEYETDGDCQRALCEIRSKPRDNNLIRVARHASAPNGTVALLTVQQSTVPMIMQWLCWIRLLQFNHFLFMPDDIISSHQLQSLYLPALERTVRDLAAPAVDYASERYHEMIIRRLKDVEAVLSGEKSVLLGSVDTIWLENPLDHLIDKSCHVQLFNGRHYHSHTRTQYGSDFIWIRHGTIGRLFWRAVIQCQERNKERIMQLSGKNGSEYPLSERKLFAYTEHRCIRDIGLNWEKTGRFDFKFCQAESEVFSDSQSVFDEQEFSRTGVFPASIRFTENSSNPLLFSPANEFLVWDQEKKVCKLSKPLAAAVPNGKVNKSQVNRNGGNHKIKLGISILTSHRLNSLKRLLNSLLDNNFDGLENVELTVFVDYPANSSLLEQHRRLKRFIRKANWPHGEFTVKVHRRNQGVESMWLNAFQPTEDLEMRLILEDDLELSSLALQFLLLAVRKHAISNNNSLYHPHLYGISLQRQHSVVGESLYQRYGSVNISQRVDGADPIYGFQQLGTWGSLFFGRAWLEFQQWYSEKCSDPDHSPCIPSFVSNAWWQRRKRSVWSVWHIRWAFERGMFSLYFNLDQLFSVPGKCLIANHKEDGENFHGVSSAGPSCQLLTPQDWSDAMENQAKNSNGDDNGSAGNSSSNTTVAEDYFSKTSQIPFFDFHFNRVHCLACVRERWRLLSGLATERLCDTITNRKFI